MIGQEVVQVGAADVELPGRPGPPERPRVRPRWVRDLEVMDAVLEKRSDVTERLVAIVEQALRGHDSSPLSAEQWLRVLLVQQTSRFDGTDMGFYMNDSQTCRAFCQMVDVQIPTATICANLERVDDETWKRIEAELRPLVGKAWKRIYSTRLLV